MAQFNSPNVYNFLVPQNGQINAVAIQLPNAVVGGADGYTVDFNALAQFQQGPYFQPQACTVDATELETDVTFTVPLLGFKRVIQAGTGATFQFPSPMPLTCPVEPGDGVSSFNVVFYNFPALPDSWSA